MIKGTCQMGLVTSHIALSPLYVMGAHALNLARQPSNIFRFPHFKCTLKMVLGRVCVNGSISRTYLA
jgi:hypothetical protein